MGKKKKVEEPQYILSPINTQLLNYKVYKMSAKEKILYFLGLFVIGGLVGYLFYGGLFQNEDGATMATNISNIIVFIGGGILANKVFMPIVNENLRAKRLTKLKVQFRDFLSALATSMSSGMNVNDALICAYNDLCVQYSKDSFIACEVLEMIQGTQNNISMEDTLQNFGERSGIDDISNFGSVFSVSYRTGGNLKDVIKRSADIIGTKMTINEEIETTLTSNKMQLNVMMVIPVVLMLMLKGSSQDFARSYTSFVGVVAVTIALACFVGAYVLGNKIMNIKG